MHGHCLPLKFVTQVDPGSFIGMVVFNCSAGCGIDEDVCRVFVTDVNLWSTGRCEKVVGSRVEDSSLDDGVLW